MPIFSSTIQNHVANTMSQPYYRFDGASDEIYSSTSNNFAYDDTTPFSISVRFKTTDSDTALVEFESSTKAYDAVGMMFFGTASGKIAFNMIDYWASRYISITTTPTYNDDLWHHAVVTFNGTSLNTGLNIYVDGVSPAVTRGGAGVVTAFDATNELRIGSDNFQSFYTGEISDVKIHNLALSATEVKELYAGASVPFKYKGASEAGITTSFGTGETGWDSDGHGLLSYDGSGGLYSGGRLDTQLITPHSHKRFRVSYNVTAISITSNYFRFRYTNASGAQVYGPTITSTGVGSWEFTADAVSGTQYLYILTWDGDNEITMTDVRFTLIGAVAEYDGSGITNDKWYDKSGNGLDGTVSGATDENTAGAPWISANHPAFFATPSGTQDNITDGTTVAFATEIFDQDDNFGSSIFTAPVAGRYQFSFGVRGDNITANGAFKRVKLVTSNRNIEVLFDPETLAQTSAYYTFTLSVLCDMDLSDTALVQWSQSGGVTTQDIDSGSWFSGYLVC